MTLPAAVPASRREEYIQAYTTLTRGTDRLFLFAGDQKVEHLNKDFFGDGIHTDDATPEHLFKIASQAPVGGFASQLGLISRYGLSYQSIPYIVKLNSKTNIIPKNKKDPLSTAWYDIEDIIHFRRHSGLHICGIGYTLFLGSEYEHIMLREAAQAILEAHHNGLVAMVWIYPRGSNVTDETSADIITGAAGVAACLGADFVKINPPSSPHALSVAVQAAGTTGVVCAGGPAVDEKSYFKALEGQLDAGARGCAVGRNIHQKSLSEAVSFCEKIAQTLNTYRV